VNNRVVITGLGVVAPNGAGLPAFGTAIRKGVSGIRHFPELEALNFSCCIGGVPPVTAEMQARCLSPLQLRNFNSPGILYGCIAGIEAWTDAGLSIREDGEPDWDSGTVFGAGSSSAEKFRESVHLLEAGELKKMGSNAVVQIMASGISAYLGGILGLGNAVTTNSSACCTGTEAILMGYERIRSGMAKRMLTGGCNDHGPYVWGGFDAMRVLSWKYNDAPEKASRPMSAKANGFVPGSGAGALLLESLDSALERGATIYAEVLGGAVNSGGQRSGGSMTAPNSVAVQRCISMAVERSGIHPDEIDLINGHLTATMKDPDEIRNWSAALNRKGNAFPLIHSLKSMIGHCLSAAGAIESVAAVLGLHGGFVFPSINCEDPHPEICEMIPADKIPTTGIEKNNHRVVAKASFGFGDINACIIFKKYDP